MSNHVDLPNLDEDLVRMPADILEDLAEMGRSSLFFFSKAVLGYNKLTEKCHGPVCEWYDRNGMRFKMLLMPRDHYKTTVGTISRSLQAVCKNPERRRLILNEVGTNTERWLRTIQSHAEKNKRFRTLYSKIIPKDLRKVRWNSTETDFVRQGHYPEPTIVGLGMTGTKTSQHFTDITVDDPVSEEAAKSPKVMQDAIDRLKTLEAIFVEPEDGTLDVVGTRWTFHDVFDFLMKAYGNDLSIFKRSVIENDELIFPELMSWKTLARIRRTQGEYLFSCLYMNTPRNPDLQDFNVDDIKFFEFTPDYKGVILFAHDGTEVDRWRLDQLDITATIDPAPPPAKQIADNDRNGMTTVGISPKNQIIVLDAWGERTSPLRVIEHMLWVQQVFKPRLWGIESVAYQRALKYFVQQVASELGVYFNIEDIPAKGEKTGRIRGLQPMAATGRIYLHPTQHLLRNEMSEFPLGKHDDILDSFSMHLGLFRGQMSQERWAKYKDAERRLLSDIRAESHANPMFQLASGLYVPDQRLLLPRGASSDLDPDDDVPYQPGTWQDHTFGG